MTPGPGGFTRRAFLAALLGVVPVACASREERREPPVLVSVIAAAAPAVVAIGDARTIYGSGFRLRDSAFVVTAAHVLEALGAEPPRLRWRGASYAARVVLLDHAADVGVLEVDGDVATPGLALATGDPPPLGTWVIVLGCPFGADATATTGIVSAAPGAIAYPDALRPLMQLNAAINPGNSGGPVLDPAGAVIGVATAAIPGGFGLGFAVPVATVRGRLPPHPAASR